MSKTSGSMNQTVVKILVGIFMGFIPATGWAQAPANYSEIKKDCLERAAAFKDDKAEYAFQYNSCMATSQGGRAPERIEDKGKVNCNDVQKEYKEIRNNITKACNDAGLGRSCAQNSKDCGEELEETEFDTQSAIGAALGIQMGNQQQVAQKCPQMGTRDIAEGRKSLQKEIKEDQTALADLAKEAAELQADYDKEVLQIQENLTKAQEDYKKKEKEFSKDERERIEQFHKTQAQAVQDMASQEMQLLGMQSQRDTELSEKAKNLNDLSESMISLACEGKVDQLKKDYEKLITTSKSNTGNFIGEAKRKRAAMLDAFKKCTARFSLDRIEMIKKSNAKVEMIDKQIRSGQSKLDNIQSSLNLAETQLAEIAKDASESKKEAFQSVIDMGTRLQQQMQSAYSKLQKNLQALQAKSAALDKSLKTSSNELQILGPVPKTKKDLSASDASQTISDEIRGLNTILNNPEKKKCIPGIDKEVNQIRESHGAK